MTAVEELKVALIAWAATCTLACLAFLAGWAYYSVRGWRRSRRRRGGLPDDLFRRIGGGS